MTKDDIICMAKEVMEEKRKDKKGLISTMIDIARFAELVAAQEREACGLIVLDNSNAEGICCTADVLEAFRARGEK